MDKYYLEELDIDVNNVKRRTAELEQAVHDLKPLLPLAKLIISLQKGDTGQKVDSLKNEVRTMLKYII
jgi:hypothetical protein